MSVKPLDASDIHHCFFLMVKHYDGSMYDNGYFVQSRISNRSINQPIGAGLILIDEID